MENVVTNYWHNSKLKIAKRYGERISDDKFFGLKYKDLQAAKKVVVILITNNDFISAPILDTQKAFKYWRIAYCYDKRLWRFFIFKKSVFERLQSGKQV